MTARQEDIRHRLVALREELTALSELSEEARSTVHLDQQSVGRLSRMDAMQMQAMAQAAERQRGLEVQKIDAALRRLEEDEYGYCVDCGEAIAPGRLEIDPAAALCIRCAQGRPHGS